MCKREQAVDSLCGTERAHGRPMATIEVKTEAMCAHARMVIEHAVLKMLAHHLIYFQWSCVHCGQRQAFKEADQYYKFGDCYACNARTNVLTDEMAMLNFIAIPKV